MKPLSTLAATALTLTLLSGAAFADASTKVALVPGGPHPYFAAWEQAGQDAVKDFGGSAGWTGRTYVRATRRLAQGQTLTAPISVIQVRDTTGKGVFDVYLDQARTIKVWSPAGGLACGPRRWRWG